MTMVFSAGDSQCDLQCVSSPRYTLARRPLRKPHMQLMQRPTTNSASPTHKLHSYSRLPDPVPKLVVPKNEQNN